MSDPCSRRGYSYNGSGLGGSRRGGPRRFDGKCFKCGGEDHWVAECPLAEIVQRVPEILGKCGLPPLRQKLPPVNNSPQPQPAPSVVDVSLGHTPTGHMQLDNTDGNANGVGQILSKLEFLHAGQNELYTEIKHVRVKVDAHDGRLGALEAAYSVGNKRPCLDGTHPAQLPSGQQPGHIDNGLGENSTGRLATLFKCLDQIQERIDLWTSELKRVWAELEGIPVEGKAIAATFSIPSFAIHQGQPVLVSKLVQSSISDHACPNQSNPLGTLGGSLSKN